jgi:hypothetical protein
MIEGALWRKWVFFYLPMGLFLLFLLFPACLNLLPWPSTVHGAPFTVHVQFTRTIPADSRAAGTRRR